MMQYQSGRSSTRPVVGIGRNSPVRRPGVASLWPASDSAPVPVRQTRRRHRPARPREHPVVHARPVSGLLPGETRYAAVTKSPLTGGFLDSYAGGTFPDTLAGALQDHTGILVTGRASEPVKLAVEADGATVEPAETWGRNSRNRRSVPRGCGGVYRPGGRAGRRVRDYRF